MQKLIPIIIENPAVYRNYGASNTDESKAYDLDFVNLESDVISINQFVRGIIKIPIIGGENIKFMKNDKIYSFTKNQNFDERFREDDELLGNIAYGRFQYTKSISAMDLFLFNLNIGISKKYRSKLQKICSDLIYKELTK